VISRGRSNLTPRPWAASPTNESYAAALGRIPDEQEHAADRDFLRQRLLMLHLESDDVGSARGVLQTMEVPDGPLAQESRARLALHTEDWAAARQASRRLKAAGQVGAAALLEGEVAVAEKRWSEAQKRFSEAVKDIGPAARPRIAEIYREGGRPQAGEQLLRAWVKEDSGNADARYYLGAYLYQLDRGDDWEREMREAFRLDPRHAPALNFVGYSLAERSQRLDEALELVQRALEIDAWNGAFLDSLGWVYHQMGLYDQALPPLEQAAREMPRDPTILEHLGDVYLRLGERSLALAAWERALEAGPEDAKALEDKIAMQRAAQGETEQAYEQPSEEEAQADGRLAPRPR
jgi:tetratricopeptide (TPR) repeat protein